MRIETIRENDICVKSYWGKKKKDLIRRRFRKALQKCLELNWLSARNFLLIGIITSCHLSTW